MRHINTLIYFPEGKGQLNTAENRLFAIKPELELAELQTTWPRILGGPEILPNNTGLNLHHGKTEREQTFCTKK